MIVVGAQLDAQFEAAGAIIEGRSGREVLRRTATRFGVDVLGGGIGAGLDRWALPVVVRLGDRHRDLHRFRRARQRFFESPPRLRRDVV